MTAPIHVGRIAFCPRGAYDAEEYYNKLDVVSFNSCGYLCRADCHGISPNNVQYWQIIASGSSADRLTALQDVHINPLTLEDGQVLVWDEENQYFTNGAGAGSDSAAADALINRNMTKNISFGYAMMFEELMYMMYSGDDIAEEFTINGITLMPKFPIDEVESEYALAETWGTFSLFGQLEVSSEPAEFTLDMIHPGESNVAHLVPGDTLILSGCPAGGSDSTYFFEVTLLTIAPPVEGEMPPIPVLYGTYYDYGEGCTFTIPTDIPEGGSWAIQTRFVVPAGFTGVIEPTDVKLMLRLDVFTDSSFTPPAFPLDTLTFFGVMLMMQMQNIPRIQGYGYFESQYNPDTGEYDYEIPGMYGWGNHAYESDNPYPLHDITFKSTGMTARQLMGNVPVNPSNTDDINIWIETTR